MTVQNCGRSRVRWSVSYISSFDRHICLGESGVRGEDLGAKFDCQRQARPISEGEAESSCGGPKIAYRQRLRRRQRANIEMQAAKRLFDLIESQTSISQLRHDLTQVRRTDHRPRQYLHDPICPRLIIEQAEQSGGVENDPVTHDQLRHAGRQPARWPGSFLRECAGAG